MTTTKNYRDIQVRALNASDDNAEAMIVEGYAAVFNQRTLLWESDWSGWSYYEEIDPAAFTGADFSNCVLRYNHDDAALILARTRNNSLTLNVDDKGLKVRAELAPTQAGKDIFALIKRGDIDKMSFAFTVSASSTDYDEDNKIEVRRITKIGSVYDVSPVDFPAYEGTEITARSSAVIAEIKAEEHYRRELKRLKLLASL